ncbi:MAG: DegT/DnrJ/EryC1/StrS family aminotransferase [Bacteroidales bacterium]|jgi:CDP-6-deoxy-D-xylo-4-hexulose-3-dehydrase
MRIKYPLATSTWDRKEYDAMQRVINSSIFTMGNEVALYEKKFAEKFRKRYAVMVNSGSSANLLMVAALFFRQEGIGLQPGDEVIVPAVSWSTSYTPLQQYGLVVKFIDIDLKTLNYDLEALARSITKKTRMILIVNLLGNPNDFSRIKEIVGNSEIILIEDNCESMGATYEEFYAGTLGLMGSFSSFYSHHISTMEGGMIVTDDEELFHILLSLRAHGWTRNLPAQNRITGNKSDNSFEESYKFVLPGYNLRPLELSGAIGQEQLLKLDHIMEMRRLNALMFHEIMRDFPQFIVQKEIGKSSWFGFSIIIKPESGIKRIEVLNRFTENSIETRPIVGGNFTKNPVIKFFQYNIPFKLCATEIIEENGFFIGNHPYKLDIELSILKKALKNFSH